MLYRKTLKLLKKHIQSHFTFYFALFCFFILGNILGSFVLKEVDYDTKISIFTLFHPFLKASENYSKFMIFNRVFLYNIFIYVFIVVLGIFNLGYIFIPVLITILGTTIGFRVGFLVTYLKLKGLWLSLIGIYPQYLFFIVFFLGSGSLSMSLSKNPFINSNNPRNIKRIFDNKEYIILFSFFLFVCFLGIITEVFFSPVLNNMLNYLI